MPVIRKHIRILYIPSWPWMISTSRRKNPKGFIEDNLSSFVCVGDVIIMLTQPQVFEKRQKITNTYKLFQIWLRYSCFIKRIKSQSCIYIYILNPIWAPSTPKDGSNNVQINVLQLKVRMKKKLCLQPCLIQTSMYILYPKMGILKFTRNLYLEMELTCIGPYSRSFFSTSTSC